jgi:hypothetical protein
MKISEYIKKLETLKAEKGDINIIDFKLLAANEYLDGCDWLYAEGAVYSESGYYPKDVDKALEIALLKF